MTFHDVMALFENADIDMREAYWGHPERPDCCGGPGHHSSTDGDLRFVIRIEGVDRVVTAVRKEDDAIVVTVS